MMQHVFRVDGTRASAAHGRVLFDLKKATWNGGFIAAALVLAVPTFTWAAFALFLFLTYFSLLVGHSAGMHRMMIHRTFKCPRWLERSLIYVGVLVGMAGPYGIIRIHDLRDWAQRQPECHDFFAHRRGFWRDLSWQLAYRFEFERPPRVQIEAHWADDPWYRFLERTWRYHQLLLVPPLYLLGGWSFVVWGVVVRVAVSVVGHWTITYACHNPGPGRWRVKGVAVQASDLPGLGIVTYGECWHNNHHAFPESARIGLEQGQCDPAWRFIQLLGFLRLATDLGVPRPDPERDDLELVSQQAGAVDAGQ